MTSVPPELKNFEGLIAPHLGDAQIVSYKRRYLTKPGENYGSMILAVTVHVKAANGQIEVIELVAKMPPLTELHWKLFQPDRTCPTENSIYTTIGPALEKFQNESKVSGTHKLDVFSKFYGARLSLDNDNSKIVDRNALLVLENLTTSGYKTCTRDEGFDYKHTLVVLENLAKFHAVPIAFRNANPEEFRNKILPTMKHFNINDNFDEGEFESLVDGSLADVMKLTEITNEKLLTSARHLIKLNREYMSNPAECQDGPFNTIAHYDFWVNNMMILYDEKDDPVKIKILDFQLSQYESLAHDVVFFLFSSVRTSILQEKYDELLVYYYDRFILSLESNGCHTIDYSLELFLSEIKRIALIQFSHILVMLKVLFMKRGVMPEDFADIKMDVWTQAENYDEKYFNKLKDVIVLYQKHGYL